MKKWIVGVLLLTFVISAYAFTNNWDETVPTDTESIALGAGRIRDFKQDIRERFDVEHHITSSGVPASTDGEHKNITILPTSGDPSIALEDSSGTLRGTISDNGYSLVYTKSGNPATKVMLTDGTQRMTGIFKPYTGTHPIQFGPASMTSLYLLYQDSNGDLVFTKNYNPSTLTTYYAWTDNALRPQKTYLSNSSSEVRIQRAVAATGSAGDTVTWENAPFFAGSTLVSGNLTVSGTADLAGGAASTTKVTNLNADQVDGKDSTDFLLRDGTLPMTGRFTLSTNSHAIQFGPASMTSLFVLHQPGNGIIRWCRNYNPSSGTSYYAWTDNTLRPMRITLTDLDAQFSVQRATAATGSAGDSITWEDAPFTAGDGTFTGNLTISGTTTMNGDLALGANTLTTTNTTKVANLNADMVDGVHGTEGSVINPYRIRGKVDSTTTYRLPAGWSYASFNGSNGDYYQKLNHPFGDTNFTAVVTPEAPATCWVIKTTTQITIHCDEDATNYDLVCWDD